MTIEYPSLDIPTAGAFRYNTDSSQLEIYDGNQWTGVVGNPATTTGRCVWGGGETPSGASLDEMEFVQINTTGNSIDFGNLTAAGQWLTAAASSSTRGCWFGGAPRHDEIDYITIATTGNAIDFGDLGVSRGANGAMGNQVRGITGGGDTGGNKKDSMEYITFASTGNGTDWGDLDADRSAMGACASATRGLFVGGYTPSSCNIIELVTIASTGSAQDFGDLTSNRWDLTGFASPTRGVFANGTIVAAGNQVSNIIDYVTIATTGNAQDFGDATGVKQANPGCSNSTRGLWGGGYTPSGTSNIDSVYMSTLGNAIDFGDLTTTLTVGAAFSTQTRGVWAAGYSGGNTNILNMVRFATEGDATDYGDLSRSTHRTTGASNSHGGL